MENKEIDLVELVQAIWAKKKLFIKWGLIGLVVGVIIAFSLPKTYMSSVKIASESKNNSQSMGTMGGLAAMAGFNINGVGNDGISEQLYPEIMKSSPFLLELAPIMFGYKGEQISFYDYITKEQKRAWWSHVMGVPMSLVGWVMSIGREKTHEQPIDIFRPSGTQLGYIATLNNLIKTEEDKKTSALSIKVTMQDPYIAAVIADSLLSKLQRYVTDYRTSKARADLENNEMLLKEAKIKYYQLDSTYALSQDRNRNLAMKSAQIMLERLSNEKDLAFSIYQQLASQVELGRLKVQEDTPIATIIEPASVPLYPASPNKMIIIVAFVFLGIFAIVGVEIVRFIIEGDK